MQRCPRCDTFVETTWGYCPVCGRPRILESLRARESQPAWHDPALKILVALVTFWFVVTLGVAFLREWKSVRDSRELLAQGETEEAWTLLASFLPRHPEHRQGILLSGKAAIRLDKHIEASQLLDQLEEQSPELAEELEAEYRQVLGEQAQALGCDVAGFQTLLSAAETVRPSYGETVMSGLPGLISSCRSNGDGYELRNLAAVLVERDQGLELVELGYAPAIGSAVEQRRYDEAQVLARQAVSFVPDGGAAVDEALSEERRKVSETVATVTRLCEEIGSDPRYRVGSSRCFPIQAPATAVAARDGWGGHVLYSPLLQADPAQCFRGFALTSYGADGVETPGDRESPLREIVCQYTYGRMSSQVPGRFWQLPQK